MKLPEAARSTVAEIYRWRERTADDGLRPHLGASAIGHACDRYLWLSFRWTRKAAFSGRILRLFDRGKREEAVMVRELRGIGCTVWADDGGEQFRVSALGGHFGGSMDAVAEGLPEAPRTPHVIECKTHGAKSFKVLAEKGLRAAQPRHYAQLMAYLHLAKLTRGAYFAVNKDTDEIHFERIEHDKEDGEKLVARAERIIFADLPPPRINEDPAWWECKLCDFREQCHGTEAPLATCRSCVHATPEREGAARWSCSVHHKDLGTGVQKEGCAQHRVIPVLLERFAEPVDSDGDTVTYRNKLTDVLFVNGEHPALSSADIHAVQDKRMLGQECADPTLRDLRLTFGANYAGS